MSIGSFGDRFAKIARVYGAEVTKIDVEWGQAADPAVLRAELERFPDYKAVLLTHNETSTGVMNPIPELAAVVREVAPEALILVDTVSSLGAVPFEMDAWGLDVVVTGSQKAWMSAPGLAMIAASERAWAAMETATMPRVYLDLRAHRDSHATGETPFTPAIAVVYQVDEGIRLMNAEGAASIFARHEACAAATRAGLSALGFELFADPRHASKTVTAAVVPDDLDWKAFNGEIKRRSVVLAGGQGKLDRQDLPGRPPRVGHARGDPRRDEHPRDRLDRRRAPGPPGVGGVGRPGGRARVIRDRRTGRRRGGCMRILVAEPVAIEGIELLRASHQVDERTGLTPGRAAGDPARLRRAHRPQPGPGRCRPDRRGRRGWRSSGGPGSGSTTSISRPRRGPASSSSTPRPGTRSRPPSTPSRCCTASPAGPPRPMPRSGVASGSAPSSPGSSCAAGRSASSGWARSDRPSRSGPGRWR